MADSSRPNEVPEFSLVEGGPANYIFNRLGLCGPDLEPAYKRAVVLAAAAWLPLLILSLIEGRATGDTVSHPFLHDLTVHVRFLVALPSLIAAETAAHYLMGPRIRKFLTLNIVTDHDVPKFNAAVESAKRLSGSAWVEGSILLLVYTLGLYIWLTLTPHTGPVWFATPNASGMNLTPAGYWLVFVSVPMFQFFLVRWFVRFVIWLIFLARVARLDLKLIATHSDLAGGIGFLGQCTYGFGLVLFAEGSLLSAFIANEMFDGGHNLMDFKLEALASVLIYIAMALGPLLVFVPVMLRSKWAALNDYGALASRYVRAFDEKWIDRGDQTEESLLGAADFQSLADLSNSYEFLQDMRPVPFRTIEAAWLLALTVAPLAPLLLFEFSITELFSRMVRIFI